MRLREWNDEITSRQAERMSNTEILKHTVACITKLEELGMDREDAFNMVDSLQETGYVRRTRLLEAIKACKVSEFYSEENES